jgi:RimJ/RimL family protein N-acetyltransferase
MKDAFISGTKINLRGITPDDLPDMVRWINDSEVTHFLFMGDRPAQLQLLREQWEKDMRNPNEVSFAVTDKKTGGMIGWCGLYVINWISRTAEYRVFIGEKSHWNKGLGTEIARLLIRYGFEKLNLNKVWLGVNAEHLGGFKSYEKAGFVKEGVLRQEIFRNNRYYDAVRMSILRKEYEKTK